MKVYEAGTQLDAEFSVQPVGGQTTLVIESRGGSAGAPNERNSDYGVGLTLLLERLAAMGAVVLDAQVVSSTAVREYPDERDRRLQIDGGYPLVLAGRDADEIRRRFGRAQRTAARDPSLTSSGNNNKRVQFWLDIDADPTGLEATLAGGLDAGDETDLAAFVYVPASTRSRHNLDIGIQEGVWGFTAETMAQSDYLGQFRMLNPGDVLVLGHTGPQPRVPQGGWQGESLGLVCEGLVTAVAEDDTDEVWPDGVYPFRVYFDLTSQIENARLNPDAMEALRLSANQRGRPVLLDASPEVLVPQDSGAGNIEIDGPLDRLSQAKRRREQAKLRARRLGNATHAPCDLCGADLPIRHLRIAHIKKRALCTDTERLDPAVVMTACIECDLLFEVGDLVVTDGGEIVAGQIEPTSPDLVAAIQGRVGGHCSAYSDSSSPYFDFHRAQFEDQ